MGPKLDSPQAWIVSFLSFQSPSFATGFVNLKTIMATNNTRTCYTPNGAVWEGHTPCNQAADESHCCGSNDFCLSNGHCLQAEGVYANRIGRGSCTDSSWRSEACPYECSDGKNSLRASMISILADANVSQSEQIKIAPSSSPTKRQTVLSAAT